MFGAASDGTEPMPASEGNVNVQPLPTMSSAADRSLKDETQTEATAAPVRFPMPRGFPMSFRPMFSGMSNSPLSVHILPFGVGGLRSSSDFFPISRPLRSLSELTGGSPLFSRSITISSDGTKTVRQETSRDADGLVTTTTTTTTTRQKPEPQTSRENQDENAQQLFNSVMEDMPAELKEILGIAELSGPAIMKSDASKMKAQRSDSVSDDQSDDNDEDEDQTVGSESTDGSADDDENEDDPSEEVTGNSEAAGKTTNDETTDGEQDDDSEASEGYDADTSAVKAAENQNVGGDQAETSDNENESTRKQPFVIELDKVLDPSSMGSVLEV